MWLEDHDMDDASLKRQAVNEDFGDSEDEEPRLVRPVDRELQPVLAGRPRLRRQPDLARHRSGRRQGSGHDRGRQEEGRGARCLRQGSPGGRP